MGKSTIRNSVALALLLALLAIVPAARASAPTFHGSASNPADNGSQADAATLTITPPASMSSGDLVVVLCTVQVAAFATAPSVNATGGQSWSAGSDITGANDMDVRVFWTQYNGTWGANPSFTIASESGTQPASCIMHVFRPSAVGTWEVDTAIAGGAEASADPITVTGFTPNKKDTVSLACALIPNASTFSEDSSDWTITSTAQYRNTAGSDLSVSCAYQLKGAAAATGDASFNPSTAAAGISFTMAWNNALVPTISPNTADAHNFGSDTTPTLEATATDGNADDVRYDFQIDSVNTFDSQVGTPVIADLYSESNDDGSSTTLSGSNNGCAAQSFNQLFTGKLTQVKFYARKVGSPTGNATAAIYAHSGTYGSSSVATGSALATSGNFDVSTLTGSLALITLTFTGADAITLSSGTNYVVGIRYTGGDASNNVVVGRDSVGTHTGNHSLAGSGDCASSPTAFANSDDIFYLYVYGGQLYKISGTDSGFANTVTGGDTDPFNSGEKVSFTVQAGDALAGGTWYWRARAKDPDGSNTYSSWTTTRSFSVSSTPPEDVSPQQVID